MFDMVTTTFRVLMQPINKKIYVDVKHTNIDFPKSLYNYLNQIIIDTTKYGDILNDVMYDRYDEYYTLTPLKIAEFRQHPGIHKFPIDITNEPDAFSGSFKSTYGYEISVKQAATIIIWNLFTKHMKHFHFEFMDHTATAMKQVHFFRPECTTRCFWVRNSMKEAAGNFYYPKNAVKINAQDYGCNVSFRNFNVLGANNITLNQSNDVSDELNQLCVDLNTQIVIADGYIHMEKKYKRKIMNLINNKWIKINDLIKHNIHNVNIKVTYEKYDDVLSKYEDVWNDGDIVNTQLIHIDYLSSQNKLNRINVDFIKAVLRQDNDVLILVYTTYYNHSWRKNIHLFSKNESIITLLKMRLL